MLNNDVLKKYAECIIEMSQNNDYVDIYDHCIFITSCYMFVHDGDLIYKFGDDGKLITTFNMTYNNRNELFKDLKKEYPEGTNTNIRQMLDDDLKMTCVPKCKNAWVFNAFMHVKNHYFVIIYSDAIEFLFDGYHPTLFTRYMYIEFCEDYGKGESYYTRIDDYNNSVIPNIGDAFPPYHDYEKFDKIYKTMTSKDRPRIALYEDTNNAHLVWQIINKMTCYIDMFAPSDVDIICVDT